MLGIFNKSLNRRRNGIILFEFCWAPIINVRYTRTISIWDIMIINIVIDFGLDVFISCINRLKYRCCWAHVIQDGRTTKRQNKYIQQINVSPNSELTEWVQSLDLVKQCVCNTSVSPKVWIVGSFIIKYYVVSMQTMPKTEVSLQIG